MTNFMCAESAKRDVRLVSTTRLVLPPTIGLFGRTRSSKVKLIWLKAFIFSYILLVFSLACTLATLILMGLVYSYRKLKVCFYTFSKNFWPILSIFQVFRFGSPAFLCLTLLGCAIMYLEVSYVLSILMDLGNANFACVYSESTAGLWPSEAFEVTTTESIF